MRVRVRDGRGAVGERGREQPVELVVAVGDGDAAAVGRGADPPEVVVGERARAERRPGHGSHRRQLPVRVVPVDRPVRAVPGRERGRDGAVRVVGEGRGGGERVRARQRVPRPVVGVRRAVPRVVRCRRRQMAGGCGGVRVRRRPGRASWASERRQRVATVGAVGGGGRACRGTSAAGGGGDVSVRRVGRRALPAQLVGDAGDEPARGRDRVGDARHGCDGGGLVRVRPREQRLGRGRVGEARVARAGRSGRGVRLRHPQDPVRGRLVLERDRGAGGTGDGREQLPGVGEGRGSAHGVDHRRQVRARVLRPRHLPAGRARRLRGGQLPPVGPGVVERRGAGGDRASRRDDGARDARRGVADRRRVAVAVRDRDRVPVSVERGDLPRLALGEGVVAAREREVGLRAGRRDEGARGGGRGSELPGRAGAVGVDHGAGCARRQPADTPDAQRPSVRGRRRRRTERRPERVVGASDLDLTVHADEGQAGGGHPEVARADVDRCGHAIRDSEAQLRRPGTITRRLARRRSDRQSRVRRCCDRRDQSQGEGRRGEDRDERTTLSHGASLLPRSSFATDSQNVSEEPSRAQHLSRTMFASAMRAVLHHGQERAIQAQAGHRMASHERAPRASRRLSHSVLTGSPCGGRLTSLSVRHAPFFRALAAELGESHEAPRTSHHDGVDAWGGSRLSASSAASARKSRSAS